MTEPASLGLAAATVEQPLPVPGRALVRNTLLNFAGLGVPLLVALATIPFLVRRLGESRFGVLSVDWIILNSAPIFDLGLGRAVRKRVAEALGTAHHERVASITWTAVLAQCLSGTLGMLALAALASPLVEHILNIPPELRSEARTTFYLVAGAIPLIVLTDTFCGVLEAAQRFDLVNAIRVPFHLALALAPLIGALLGWTLTGIATLLLLSAAAILALQFLLSTHVFPSLRQWPRPSLGELRALLRFGRWIAVSNVVGPILVYLDRFVVGVLLPMTAVAHYAAPYELVTHLSLLPASLAATLFPAFSALRAQARLEQMQAYASRSVKYLLLLLGPVILLTVAFSPDIIAAWVGPTFGEDSSRALRLLAIGVLLNALAQVPYSVVQAGGRPDLTAKFHLLELPLHAVAAFALVWAWGVPGAALAWTLRVLLDTVLLFAAAARLGGLRLSVPSRERLVYAGAFALLGLIAAGAPLVLATGWLRFAVPGAMGLAAGGALWRCVLDEHDRAHVLQLFGRSPAMTERSTS
ncbi:MAG: flippase [Myxococcales bacterium]